MAAQMVPDYILHDEEYQGGVVPKKKDPRRFLTKFWVPAIIDRVVKLQAELGKQFNNDPNVELFNLEETALGMHCDKVEEYGYSHEAYTKGLIRRMEGAKKAFPDTNVVQYINNAGCGGGLIVPPRLIEHAKKIGVGLGGPDIRIHSANLERNIYHSLCPNKGILPIAYAAQRGNYTQKIPNAEGFYKAEDVLKFAREKLCVDYIFWVRRKPYFERDVVPLVRKYPTLK